MGKLRLIFVKEGRAVYISHLDLLRTFQRVFLRQGLVLRHSQGFHPHPMISFALPLPVGQASDCEILDFEVTEEREGAGLTEALNGFMPEGIRAVDCYVPVHPVRDLAAIHCKVDFIYQNLLLGDSLVIQKRTKRKAMADVDIRPLLYSLQILEESTTLHLDAVVSAQNPGMNPALLAVAVGTHLPELAPDFIRVRRVGLLDTEGRPFR